MTMSFTIVPGRKKNNLLFEDGYRFYKSSSYKDKVYYVCINRSTGCKARVTLKESSNSVLVYNNNHNHVISKHESAIRDIKEKLRCNAALVRTSTKRTVTDIINSCDENIRSKLPSINAMSQCVRRVRRRISRCPSAVNPPPTFLSPQVEKSTSSFLSELEVLIMYLKFVQQNFSEIESQELQQNLSVKINSKPLR